MNEQWVYHPAFQDILRSIRRSWILELTGWCSLAVLLFCIIWIFAGTTRVVATIGLIVPFWGIYMLWTERPEHGSPLYHLFIREPEKIIWVYGYLLTRAPLGIVLWKQHRIFFQTVDRKSYALDIPESRYLVVMKWLNRAMPHVVFGWDELRYQRWLNDGTV